LMEFVIPMKMGIQHTFSDLDSRLRGNDSNIYTFQSKD